MNNVNLVGRLTRNPEIKYVGDLQTPVAEFTIAVDRKIKNQENNTDFIQIQTWNKQAENCEKYLLKGDLVGITGEIRVDKYKNKEGENRYITRVKANTVKFLSSKKSENSSNGKYYDSGNVFDNKQIDAEKMELPF